jgi:hypothetical protein
VAVAVPLAAEVAGLAVTVVVTDAAGVEEDEEQPAVTRQMKAAAVITVRVAAGNTDVPFMWAASHTPVTQYDDTTGRPVGATPDHASKARKTDGPGQAPRPVQKNDRGFQPGR